MTVIRQNSSLNLRFLTIRRQINEAMFWELLFKKVYDTKIEGAEKENHALGLLVRAVTDRPEW